MSLLPSGRLTLRFAHAILAIVMLVTCGLLTYFYAWAFHGREGIVSSLSAGAVCWAGAGLSMTATTVFRQPERALALTAVGMALRMGLPLVAVIVVMLQNGPLSRSGFVICILIYYLVSLLVETWLTVKLVSSANHTEAN